MPCLHVNRPTGCSTVGKDSGCGFCWTICNAVDVTLHATITASLSHGLLSPVLWTVDSIISMLSDISRIKMKDLIKPGSKAGKKATYFPQPPHQMLYYFHSRSTKATADHCIDAQDQRAPSWTLDRRMNQQRIKCNSRGLQPDLSGVFSILLLLLGA